MSVQLVLYPQNYEGRYSATSISVFNEYVADNQNFNTLLNNTGYDSTASDPSLDAINNSVAIAAWKRFRSTGGAFSSVTMPSRSNANKLELYSANGSTSSSGVYQKIIGLTQNTVYDLTINITQAGAGGLLVIGTAGNITTQFKTLGGQTLFTSISTGSTGTQSLTFTADSSEEILLLAYQNDNGSTVYINKISIKESAQQPTQIFTDLDDGQVICDLYEDEDIPLSLSIDNFKNVAEKVQSYSKDFNLPATKRNNKIFTHLFEVTKTQDTFSFNPYLKTECILKQNGYNIFKGYLRIIDIINKEGEISYNVNLYSEPIAFKDELENKTLRDLDFKELEHLYNKTNIKASWYDSTGITLTTPLSTTSNAYDASLGVNNTKVLKYPFVNWVGDFALDVDDNIILETLEDAFRPFISCKYIVDQIFDATQFTYTSNFFDSTNFTNLFMDFNWGSGNAPTTSRQTASSGYYKSSATNYAPNGSYGNLHLTAFAGSLAQVDYDISTNKITATTNNVQYTIDYQYEIKINNVSPNPSYSARWLITKAGTGVTQEINLVPIQTVSSNQVIIYSGTLTEILDNGDTLEPQFYSSWTSTNSIVQNFDGINSPPLSTAEVTISKSILSVSSETLLETLRGDIGQWQFFKGLVNMFNLVMLQNKDDINNITIEPYNDVFISNTTGTTLAARGIAHDWTDKIDITEIKLTPLDLTDKTIFKYDNDDNDYPLKYYKSITGEDYGSFKHLGFNNTLSLLTGEQEISASPFSATVIKPIADYLNDFIVPVIYTGNDTNTEFSSYDNNPRILFKVSASPYTLTAGTEYKIPTQNGVSGEQATQYLRFSHTSSILSLATDTDMNYGEHQLLCGSTPVNNLYHTYWSKYYEELYNPDTKYMTLKVNLNASDINQFNFYDKVMIKNKEYRVNKIDYKPNDLSTVEFILIG